jgi:hypothetical protein
MRPRKASMTRITGPFFLALPQLLVGVKDPVHRADRAVECFLVQERGVGLRRGFVCERHAVEYIEDRLPLLGFEGPRANRARAGFRLRRRSRAIDRRDTPRTAQAGTVPTESARYATAVMARSRSCLAVVRSAGDVSDYGKVFLDVENDFRPPEFPRQLGILSLQPFVFLDQRRVRIDLPAVTLRRQGRERGGVALLPPCRKVRRRRFFAPECALSWPGALTLSAWRKIRALYSTQNRRRDAFSGTAGSDRTRVLSRASGAAAVVVQSSSRSPSGCLLALYSNGDEAGVSPIIGTEGISDSCTVGFLNPSRQWLQDDLSICRLLLSRR